MGGPRKPFTEALGNEICLRVINGEPIAEICEDEHMPDATTVLRWCKKFPEFAKSYKRAQTLGAPRIHDHAALLDLFNDYIEHTEIPIISEFASMNGLHRQQLYEMPALADALKRCITKKEMALEKKGLHNEVNTTMAIFSLKQLGWKDQVNVQSQVGITISPSDAEL